MVLRGTVPVEEGPLRLEEVETPEPGPGQVRLKVRANGVCRTDLHVVEGDLPDVPSPLVPGHQVVGTVDALGEDVEGWSEGERAGLAWLQGTCGSCEHCREDDENLCFEPRFTGYHVHGGYAEHCLAPARWLHRLPDGVEDLAATPLLCAGIIGYRSLRRSRIEAGQRLGLWGFGNSAHVTIQVALHLGCEVFVFSHRENHRELAREMGAAWVGASEHEPPEKLHASILFAPVGDLVPPALATLRRGGRLAVAGIHLSDIPALSYDEHLFQERELVSVTANTRDDARELLELAAEIPIRTRVAEYALEDANRALRDLKENRIDGAAALVP